MHLLATPPSGDADVVTMLREAARSALGGGAPDTAAALLRRALDEPPADARSTARAVRTGNRRARDRGCRRARPPPRVRRDRYRPVAPCPRVHRAGMDHAPRRATPARATSALRAGRRRRPRARSRSWLCSSRRRGWAPCCSTRTCPPSAKTKPTRFAELACADRRRMPAAFLRCAQRTGSRADRGSW